MSKKFFAIGAVCLLCLCPSVLFADDGGAQNSGQEDSIVDVVVDLIDDLGQWIGDILPSNSQTEGEGEEEGGEGSPDYTGSVDPVG